MPKTLQAKESPINFRSEFIPKIMDGTKVQTRRLIKPPLPNHPTIVCGKRWGFIDGDLYYCGVKCPFGRPGDRLWVRENHQYHQRTWRRRRQDWVVYAATATDEQKVFCDKWHPASKLPRWASRITLEITNVRVERVQDITVQDAISEGMPPEIQPKSGFAILWEKIYGRDAWERNDFVGVLDFKKVPQ